MEFYLEIREKNTAINSFKPKEVFRKYVANEAEAEAVFAAQEANIRDRKAFFCEMNHNPDVKLNQPCVRRDITRGKVAPRGVNR